MVKTTTKTTKTNKQTTNKQHLAAKPASIAMQAI